MRTSNATQLDARKGTNHDPLLGYYTEEQLRAAFDLVCDQQNWKQPINALVTVCPMLMADVAELIRCAVGFYAGSVAQLGYGERTIAVKAAGYYADVGA